MLTFPVRCDRTLYGDIHYSPWSPCLTMSEKRMAVYLKSFGDTGAKVDWGHFTPSCRDKG